MARRLAVFSDGTGNSSAKAEKTNVWRLFEAMDQSMPDQLARYDDGVGTSRNKYLAALGGTFGFGLKRNVIDLYKFICRNHNDGDEIYGFGFSRGAFTIRMLVDLIDNQGLVPFEVEEDLHANAVLAYRRFRAGCYPSRSPVVWLARRLRDLVLYPFTRDSSAALKRARKNVPVRFLGLWDTVAAYGMPIDELRQGISLLIWPMVTPDHKLSVNVQRACHALSLDDQRETFHPILIDEDDQASGTNPSATHRITQVWFAGVHSNVGGGYPEDQLSLVTLDWMASQVAQTDLRLNADALKEATDIRSAYARLYDSRAGAAAYYRYSPRVVDMGCDMNKKPVLPIVHGSVIMRMARGWDAYAPISLPAKFNVLAPDGSLIPMHGFPMGTPPGTLRLASIAPHIDDRVRALRDAIKLLNPDETGADLEMVGQVEDTVWWRRVIYFACLFSTLCVVAFPYASGMYTSLLKTLVGRIPLVGGAMVREIVAFSAWFTPTWKGWTRSAFELVSGWIPKFGKAWLDALSDHPLPMLLALALVAAFYATGQFLATRVHGRAWYAWHPAKRPVFVRWVLGSAKRSRNKAIGLLAVFLVALGACLAGDVGPALTGTCGVGAVLMVFVLIWRARLLTKFRKHVHDDSEQKAPLPSTPTLQLARWLRSNDALLLLYRVLASYLIPFVFAALLLYAIWGALYVVALTAVTAGGAFCGAGEQSDEFDTKQMCWSPHVDLVKGTNYRFTLTIRNPWKDRSLPADAHGVSKLVAAHVLATPMLHSLSGRWFQPIVREGAVGNEEHLMDAAPGANTAMVVFTARRNGPAYIYVNDAVLLIPGSTSHFFYDNNSGTATIGACQVAFPGRKDDLKTPMCEAVAQ